MTERGFYASPQMLEQDEDKGQNKAECICHQQQDQLLERVLRQTKAGNTNNLNTGASIAHHLLSVITRQSTRAFFSTLPFLQPASLIWLVTQPLPALNQASCKILLFAFKNSSLNKKTAANLKKNTVNLYFTWSMCNLMHLGSKPCLPYTCKEEHFFLRSLNRV